MMPPAFEVAGVLQENENKLKQCVQNTWQLRTLHALRKCRTAELGGHIDRCDHPACGKLHLSYNSCRNRHCPKCQGHLREQWMRAREDELLNVPYFHVVFTLPHEINQLCLHQPKAVYDTLFEVGWAVARDFAKNPKFLGAKSGMIAILHTWGQNLSLHPHLHCIVPGGGINKQGKWKQTKSKGKFLFPVKAMSHVFRARFAAALARKTHIPASIRRQLFSKNWVVYCKRPFFGPRQIVEYLGRYTHKIAISNHRIKNIEDARVTFSVKDYRHGGKKRLLTLPQMEFIRRFALHILPKGFVRIRHYGILSSTAKKNCLPALQKQLGLCLPEAEKPPLLIRKCPCCKTGNLITVKIFAPRGPPTFIQRVKNNKNHDFF